MPPTTQQQIDALRVALEALQARQDAADRTREDTHKRVQDMQVKVDAMYRALMEPQIGQGDESLIERMAAVTVSFESGLRVATGIKWMAALIVAVGILWASMRFGVNPKE